MIKVNFEVSIGALFLNKVYNLFLAVGVTSSNMYLPSNTDHNSSEVSHAHFLGWW